MKKIRFLSSSSNQTRLEQVGAAIVIGLAVVIGIHFISNSHAASPYVRSEAESGSLSGPAAIESDPTASGGEAVLFGSLPSSSNPITAGDSKSNCIELNNPGGVMSDSELTAITAVTNVTYNCVITFDNPMPAWTDWENPWPFRITSDGWDAWVAENSSHQVVLGQDLIPDAISDNDDPLTWEQPCDAGDYDSYATQLGENLVADGVGNTVIRLGIEANGGWEVDYVGQTTQEQNDWAQCYDNEVTALRAVPGAHFLFVWNPNICTNDLALSEWYPGNSYVDIIGADAYDLDCGTVETVAQEGWTAYSTDSSQNSPNNPDFPSLANIEAFAVANDKPLSFPEWGLDSGYSDDATYVTDIGNMVNNDNTSFESYFDCGCDSIEPLGSTIPLATAAYTEAFK
jgi:hypothetical protein